MSGKVDQISPVREVEITRHGALFLYGLLAAIVWATYITVAMFVFALRIFLMFVKMGGLLSMPKSPSAGLARMRERIAPRSGSLQTFRVAPTDAREARVVECLLRGDQHGASIALGDNVEVTGRFDGGSMGRIFVVKRVRNLTTGAITVVRKRSSSNFR